MADDDLKLDKELKEAAVLGIDVFDKDIQAAFDADPALKKEVMGDLVERERRFQVSSKKLQILRQDELARIRGLKEQIAALTQALPNAPNPDEVIQQIQNLQSDMSAGASYRAQEAALTQQRQDALLFTDVQRETEAQMTPQVVDLGEGVELTQRDMERLLADPQELADMARDLQSRGNDTAVEELSRIVSQSQAGFEQVIGGVQIPAQTAAPIEPAKSPDAVGFGAPEENIQANIAGQLRQPGGGFIGSEQEIVSNLARAFQSVRARREAR